MANWHAVAVTVAPQFEEPISALLVAVGSTGVAVSPAEPHDGETVASPTDSADIRVTGYFPETVPLAELLAEISHRFAELNNELGISMKDVATSTVGDTDWAAAWKPYYTPTRITHDITILPSWTTDYRSQPKEIVISLDPDTAFGTGTHPTTRLAIFALEQVIRGGETVIDVGTGSGVLAIIAAQLGSEHVLALDNDAVATVIAVENIARNPNTDRIDVEINDLLRGVEATADIIIANILADVLVQMVDDAARLLNPGGHVILSGIYSDQIARIAECAQQAGFAPVTWISQGDWHCVVLSQIAESPGS